MQKQIGTFAKKSNSQAGFTLIELLVVMVIMAALVFIAASSFQSTQLKSRDAKRKSDLKQIATALETYYADKGYYPAANASYEIIGCGTASNVIACPPGSEFAQTNTGGAKTIYMVQIPTDPRSGNYVYVSDGRSYQLFARLENHRDPGVKNPDDNNANQDENVDIYGSVACGNKIGCNYGLSSTNVSLEPVLN